MNTRTSSWPLAPEPWHIKQCLQQAISVMEACYHWAECRMPGNVQHWGRWPTDDAAVVQHDLVRLCQSGAEPTFSVLVDVARDFAIRRCDAVAWYGRRCSPVTTALLILCAEAGVPWERACRGRLFDEDVPKLTAAAGKVASSPLILCDARHAPSLIASLGAFLKRNSLRVAICDSVPSSNDLQGIRDLCRLFRLSAVFPRP